MRKSLVLIALLAGACSRGPETAPLQQRITELEEQNAQLQRDLKKATDNVAALQRIMNSNAAANEETPPDEVDTPGEPVVSQPGSAHAGVNPPPQQ